MSNGNEPDFTMDPTTLYREDVFTDARAGTIRCMTPVNADGSVDTTRPALYHGQAQVYTPAGVLPINFEIPVATLAEAVASFGAAAQKGLHDTLEELKEMRRQQASSIVLPGAGAAPAGKIQLR